MHMLIFLCTIAHVNILSWYLANNYKFNVTHDCSDDFKSRCLSCGTEAAVLVSEYRLSLDVPVTVWRASGKDNMTMSTMVDTRNCLPIYEEMYLATPGRNSA